MNFKLFHVRFTISANSSDSKRVHRRLFTSLSAGRGKLEFGRSSKEKTHSKNFLMMNTNIICWKQSQFYTKRLS